MAWVGPWAAQVQVMSTAIQTTTTGAVSAQSPVHPVRRGVGPSVVAVPRKLVPRSSK